jgi:hypothetical protein
MKPIQDQTNTPIHGRTQQIGSKQKKITAKTMSRISYSIPLMLDYSLLKHLLFKRHAETSFTSAAEVLVRGFLLRDGE